MGIVYIALWLLVLWNLMRIAASLHFMQQHTAKFPPPGEERTVVPGGILVIDADGATQACNIVSVANLADGTTAVRVEPIGTK